MVGNVENTNGHAEEKVSELDGAAPDSTDSALYFCTYAYLFHQVSCRMTTDDHVTSCCSLQLLDR